MSKITVYGVAGATCTQRVLAAALENDYDINLVTLDMKNGEHKQPAHLARQPFGKIPAMEDGNVKIYESRAICRYVNETKGNKLVPKDAGKRALMEQWLSLEYGTISPQTEKICMERVFKPMFGQPTNEEEVKKAAAAVAQGLDVMDKQLSTNQYLTGDQFTLADLFFYPYFNLIFNLPEKSLFESRPNIMAWWGRISARPAWQKVLALGKAK